MISGDTIAAIATAPGPAGVAVVRISGPDAFAVARKIATRFPAPGAFTYARLVHDGRTIDDGLVLAFPSPHSYTGEDVVELQCHGGSVTPRRVLTACLAAGARLARRGEFTQRAYLNGKLDYEQAEAVLDLINAKTDRAADCALEQLEHRGRKELRALYDSILALAASLAYALDIDEGELPDNFHIVRDNELQTIKSQFAAAIKRIKEGRILRDGALVVLAGPPNAGKSSLMNALLGESRAIVSSVPGTTRDSIEESLSLDGWPVRLVDTAGLRRSAEVDAIESEGVDRAEKLIAGADLVLDLSNETVGEPCSVNIADQIRRLKVHAKCDLSRGDGVNVSAVTGEGLEELKAAIVKRLEALSDSSESSPEDSDHLAALIEARSHLPASVDDLVLAADALNRSAAILGADLGTVYTEDLLTRLFSRFCVGK